MATRHRFLVAGQEHTVVLDDVGGRMTVAIDGGDPVSLDFAVTSMPGTFSLMVDGAPQTAYVARRGQGLEINTGGRRFQVGPAVGGGRRGAVGSKDTLGEITAPLAGVVIEVRVAVGDTIVAGQPLLVIEAMKMQNEIQSPHAGVITALHCAAGQRVEQGAVVVRYDPTD